MMLECEVVIHRETSTSSRRWAPRSCCATRCPAARRRRRSSPLRRATRSTAQAAKRVGLEFVERRRASWDHRKLGGVY